MSERPYREPDVPIAPEPMKADGVEYVAGGRLVHDPKYHCKPPGWWARLAHNVRVGDKWTCTCGTEWTWSDYAIRRGDGPYWPAWTCKKDGWDPRR